ncbi:protein kinase [Planctomycetaceae bacterium]|nr:protein kinase [Planctomycetaceae bacterium]
MSDPQTSTMSLADFLEQVAISGLLSSEQMSTLRHKASGFRGSALDLAARLVQRKLLTAYQVKHLMAGRARGFFLGKYKILDPLGQGGMGYVLRAEDTETSRTVALKLLPHEATRDSDRVARFHREARAAMKLEHSNIVRTFELGQEGQLHFIAMELVEGKSLKELIAQDGRLDPERAVNLIIQVAQAVQCAAGQGIVHRDIKPSNILVTPQGTAKLLDLGLARFSDPEATDSGWLRTLTHTGHMMGTIDYVAPEQAEDPRAADVRSDIYSLGCTLYQCLTGLVPFPEGTYVQKLLKHREGDAVQPIQLVPDLDPELSLVVERMMAKQPEDRFPTADVLVEVLEGLSTSPPQPPDPVDDETASGSGEQSVDSTLAGLDHVLRSIADAADVAPLDNLLLMRKRRRWSRKTVVACVVVVIGWVFLAGYWNWAVSGRGTVVVLLSEKPDSELLVQLDDQAVVIEDIGGQSFEVATGSHRITVSSPGYVNRSFSFEIERDRRHDLEIVLEPTEEKLRQRELNRLVSVLDQRLSDRDDRQVFLQARDALRALQLAFPGTKESSRAAEKLQRLPEPVDALKREQIPADRLASSGTLMSQRLPESVVAMLGDGRLKHWTPVLCVSVSPDGRYVASGDWSELRLHEIETGRLLRSFPHVARVASVDFNFDGTRMVTVDYNRNIRIWDPRTGAKLASFRGVRGKATDVCFSPDGSLLAVAEVEQTVSLWDVRSGKPVGELAGHGGEVVSVAFDDSGRLLASADTAGGVWIWDVVTRAMRQRMAAHDGGARSIAFSPGSKVLASCGNDGTVKLWDAATGANRVTMNGHVGAANCVCFGADEGTVLSGGRDRTIRVWNSMTGKERRDPLSQNGEIVAIAYSHETHRLVTGSTDCSIGVWDMTSYSRLHLSEEHNGRLMSLDISRDGLRLATGGTDGRILLRDLSRGEIVQTLEGHTNYVTAVLFSHDGKTLVSASLDGTSKVWDLSSGTVRHDFLSGDNRMLYSLAVETGQRQLAVGDSDGKIQFWDVDRGTRVRELDCGEGSIGSLGISPDGKILVSASKTRNQLTLWEFTSGRQLRMLDGGDTSIWSQVFSPDGSTLWAVTEEGTIKSWQTKGWKPNWQVETSSRYVKSFVVSPDGTTLCTVSNDGFLRLWNADKGKQLAEVKMGPDRSMVDQAAFSSSGRHLLTANGNGSVYVFRLPLATDE